MTPMSLPRSRQGRRARARCRAAIHAMRRADRGAPRSRRARASLGSCRRASGVRRPLVVTTNTAAVGGTVEVFMHPNWRKSPPMAREAALITGRKVVSSTAEQVISFNGTSRQLPPDLGCPQELRRKAVLAWQAASLPTSRLLAVLAEQPERSASASRNRIGWPSEPIMRARERKYRFNCRSHRM